MLHVAVLLLNGRCTSTALLPMEIFHNAGVFWNLLEGWAPVPRFRVTTASVGGAPDVTDQLVALTPACALEKVERPDLVFVPAGGLLLETLIRTGYVIDAVIESNVEVILWLRQWAAKRTKVAGVAGPAIGRTRKSELTA